MKKYWNKVDVKSWFVTELQTVLDASELDEIFMRILDSLNISKLAWVTLDELEVDEALWKGIIDELKNDRPIQYILGYEYFRGKKYIVNQHVLIPRPETEELVEWVLAENKKLTPNILDIGTGTGCIPISIKKKIQGAALFATDISQQALEVAAQNAKLLDAQISFIQDDILNTTLRKELYDIIVSNPPYIPQEEDYSIASRVKDYEPHLALFTKAKQPLEFYKAIIMFALDNLHKDGKLFFEVHEDYALDVCATAHQLGFTAQTKTDIYGKTRMVLLKYDI